jgi:hypothetical protein
MGLWLDRLFRFFGLVRFKRYGLIVTAENRILSTRPTVLDDGIGGKIVGWREKDLAAMELDTWPAAAKVVKSNGRPLITETLPTGATRPVVFAPNPQRLPPMPPPMPSIVLRAPASAPEPVAMSWPVAAPAPILVATPAAAVVPVAPPPGVAPEPVVEEDEWEWQIAVARARATPVARARATPEAIEAPRPPRRMPRATPSVEDKIRAQPSPAVSRVREPVTNRLEDTVRTHAHVMDRLEDTIRTQPAPASGAPRVPYKPYRLPGMTTPPAVSASPSVKSPPNATASRSAAFQRVVGKR